MLIPVYGYMWIHLFLVCSLHSFNNLSSIEKDVCERDPYIPPLKSSKLTLRTEMILLHFCFILEYLSGFSSSAFKFFFQSCLKMWHCINLYDKPWALVSLLQSLKHSSAFKLKWWETPMILWNYILLLKPKNSHILCSGLIYVEHSFTFLIASMNGKQLFHFGYFLHIWFSIWQMY